MTETTHTLTHTHTHTRVHEKEIDNTTYIDSPVANTPADLPGRCTTAGHHVTLRHNIACKRHTPLTEVGLNGGHILRRHELLQQGCLPHALFAQHDDLDWSPITVSGRGVRGRLVTRSFQDVTVIADPDAYGRSCRQHRSWSLIALRQWSAGDGVTSSSMTSSLDGVATI